VKSILEQFAELHLKKIPVEIHGLPSSGFAFFAASFFLTKLKPKNQSLVVIAASSQEADSLAAEASFFLGEESVGFFPSPETLPYEYAMIPADVTLQRLRLLFRLLQK